MSPPLADKAVKLAKRKASAPPVVMEGESLESVYQFDYLGCRFTSDGDDAADMRHRGRTLAWSRPPVARQPLTAVTEAVPLRSERLLDPDARQRRVDANAKSAGKAQRLQLPATARHYREVVSRGGHQTFVRPYDGCADVVASQAGTYHADACRPPSAPCGVGAGPTSCPAILTPGSLLMDTPLPMHELVLRAADCQGWARDGRSLSSLKERPLRGKTPGRSYRKRQYG